LHDHGGLGHVGSRLEALYLRYDDGIVHRLGLGRVCVNSWRGWKHAVVMWLE
jgi:hypothetical protein